MAEQVTIDPEDDIAEIVDRDPKPFILDAEAGAAFVKRVRQHVAEHKPDLSTDKGRKEIASLAYKVGKAKTRIDAERKDMGAELRAKLKTINDAGKTVVEALAEIQTETRKPLTEWEAAEKARQERADSTLRELQALIQSPAPMGASVETVAERLAEVKQVEIDAATFGDDAGFAEKLKTDAIEAVSGALNRLKEAEAERAELEALRREKEEREAKAREEAEAKARAEREAEESKRREAEAQRRAEEAAERARQEERERIEAERRAEEDARAKAAAEAERKAQNKRHRARILTEVAEGLETIVMIEPTVAQRIAAAIEAGDIPHTSIQF